jgi:lipopolysaccharide biosynthesis regulator YciM
VWVSWAQLEKKHKGVDSAREVLQEGLAINKNSSCLIVAWGLLELKRGNAFAALLMLKRAAEIDPECSPVLRWKQVIEAAKRTDL